MQEESESENLQNDVVIVEQTVRDSQLATAHQLLKHHRKRPHRPANINVSLFGHQNNIYEERRNIAILNYGTITSWHEILVSFHAVN